MATLQELLDIEGVVAAGLAVEHLVGAALLREAPLRRQPASMDMSDEMAQMSAQFCATVSMMFDTLAGSFTQLSGMNWEPMQGWAYSGGDFSVAIGGGGTRGVFVETAKADFNRLFEVLVAER